MENRAYALAAGLFTLLLGLGVIATALWFSGEAVESQEFLLVSRHPISGLNLQAPVRFRGVTVGKVISIRFDPLEPRAILVGISVETGTPLSKGTYAQLGSQGVTGLSYVILDDDGSNSGQLTLQGDNLARIEFRPSFIDDVSLSGQDLINNFNLAAKRVNTLLSDENQKQLVGTLRNLDLISTKVAVLATTMTMTMKALEPTIKALPVLAQDADTVLKHADTVLGDINLRFESFERAANSAAQLGNGGAALTEVMITESLPRLSVLLEDLQNSSRRLERLLYEISEQPHSLVFGKTPLPPGPGEPGFSVPRGAK